MRVVALLLTCFITGCQNPADDMWKKAADALPGELAKAKAIGMPLELKDIGFPTNLRDKDNAAPLYRKAFALYKREGKGLETVLSDAAFAPKLSASDKAAMDTVRPLAKLVIRAASKKSCDFKRDWNDGFALLFPELSGAKGVVKVLATAALVDARRENMADASQKLLAASKLSQHIGNEPTVISMLVQIACDAIIGQRIAWLSSMKAEDGPALAKLERVLAEMRPPPSLRNALVGEIVLGRISLKQIKSVRELWALTKGVLEEPGDPPKSFGNAPMGVLRQAVEARFIEYWRRAYPSIKSDDPMAIGTALDRLATELEQKLDPSYMAISSVLPVFGQVGLAVKRDETGRLLNRVKIDVLQYKLANGKYPVSLREMGRVPTDPMDGKPLRYRLEGKGFILYGVGQDGKDDNGKARGQSPQSSGFDDVARHPLDFANLVKK